MLKLTKGQHRKIKSQEFFKKSKIRHVPVTPRSTDDMRDDENDQNEWISYCQKGEKKLLNSVHITYITYLIIFKIIYLSVEKNYIQK